MKITLLAEDVIRLTPTPGPLTIEAESADTQYSPFHMVASGLATCTFSVMHSWATHAKLSVDDLTIEVQWRFGGVPHRITNMALIFDWPSLPPKRVPAAKRAAQLCTIHATLMDPPVIDLRAASELPPDEHVEEAPPTTPVVRFTLAGDESATPGLGRPYTVVFDGDCRVCSRLATLLRTWDHGREFEVASSATPGVTARFPWIPARAYAEALQLIAEDGTTWQGASAVERILTILPKGKPVAWIFHVPFARTIADRVYKWFARNRYRLGCGVHCQSRPLDVLWSDGARAEG